MPSIDTLEERMRSVEQNASKAATAPPPADPGFAEAHRSAEEMIELMKERYQEAGAQVDALSATIKSEETAFRSEVTMSQSAAERLFGRPNDKLELRRRAEITRLWQLRCRAVHTGFTCDTPEWGPRRFEDFIARHRQPAIPHWMKSVVKLDESDQSDAALDELFDRLDAMLSSEEYEKVDRILAAMPVEGPSLTLMMGLLSITRPAAQHLRSRQRFFDRVYRLCKAMRRDAESLLGGLK